MGGDGVSEISAGAGEGVGGMVNVAGLTLGSIARSGTNGGGSTVGTETCIDNIHFRFVSSLYVLETLTCGPDDTLQS